MKIYYESKPDELMHYGVPGMKWGIHRNRASSKFARTAKKIDRIKKRADKAREKSDALLKKSKKFYLTDIGYSIHKNQAWKAAKQSKKSDRLMKRANRYIKNMEKTFSNVSVSDISKEHQNTGKNYVYMLKRNKNKKK